MSAPKPDNTVFKVFGLTMAVILVLTVVALYYKSKADQPCARPAPAVTGRK